MQFCIPTQDVWTNNDAPRDRQQSIWRSEAINCMIEPIEPNCENVKTLLGSWFRGAKRNIFFLDAENLLIRLLGISRFAYLFFLEENLKQCMYNYF